MVFFGYNFDNRHYSLSDKIRDEKRILFRNLKMIIIDEVSMVKSDMLYQLDLKLQELKELEGVPFGGVSMCLDHFHLKSQKTKNSMLRIIYITDGRCSKC